MTNRSDNFTRADTANNIGTPSDGGSAWIQENGTWGISSNSGYESAGTGHGVASLQSSISDCDVQVTVTTTGTSCGLVGRVVDSGNLILFDWIGSSLILYRAVSGSFTQIGTASYTLANGDVMKLSLSGSTINCYINGVLKIGPITETQWQTSTKHGLWTDGSAGTRFNAFSAGTGTSVNLTGASGTGSAGAFGITLSQSPTLTGVSGTGSAGTFTLAIGPAITLTGVQGTGSAGSFSPTISSNVTLVGAQGTASAGSFRIPTASVVLAEQPQPMYQRAPGATTKDIPISFTYTGGTPVGLNASIAVTGVGASYAVACTSLVASGGSGTATIPAVPQGSKFKATITETGSGVTSAQAVEWGVGILAGLAGQSNMSNMHDQSSSPPVASAWTYQYAGSWFSPVGNGDIALANAVRLGLAGTGLAGSDIPFGVLPYAVAGSGLHAAAGAYWLDLTAGAPYPLFVIGLAAAGGDVEYFLWYQGETDAKNGVSKATYKADMDTLYGRVQVSTGRNASTLKFGCVCLATATLAASSATDAQWDAIRQGHLEWIRDTTGAFFLGSPVDMPLADGIHLTIPSYQLVGGNRYAKAVLHQLGVEAYGAEGLTIASAHGKAGSAVITVNLTQHGGTGLTEADGSTGGAGQTGWQVSDDGFATTKTISSTAFSGSASVLTLSAAPADPFACQVRYQYGREPSIVTPVFDNQSPLGGALGLPLQPTIGAVTVTPDTSSGRNPWMSSVGRMMNRGA